MKDNKHFSNPILDSYLNDDHSHKWLKASLPKDLEPWIMGPYNKAVKRDNNSFTTISSDLKEHLDVDSWQWPDQVIYFFSDMHADTDAFIDSLIASGGIIKTGARDKDFKLTKEGKKARFILGGDCFDKGPSTLRLLRAIKLLIDKGADVIILAGNHDTRTLVGILSLDRPPSAANKHFFVRMGLKPLPLFKEIYETYFEKTKHDKNKHNKHKSKTKYKHYKTISSKKFRQKFFPSKDWAKKFAISAKAQLSEQAISKEIKNTSKKAENFGLWCAQQDLSLKQIYFAVQKWQDLFLSPKGEFYWYFKRIQLSFKEGSFFFVHAGADDEVAQIIRSKGVKGINKQFRKYLKSDLCRLYYGPLGNMIRTKYRDTDRKFSKKGTLMLRNAGINAIVHGHRNLYFGQRIMLRKGMVNFECDTSLDINTRKKEGVSGLGASVTIIRPEKMILGISSDYPYIKVFEPWFTINKLN